MSSLRLIPQLLERNQEYAKSHTPLPLITEFPPGTRGPKTVICTFSAVSIIKFSTDNAPVSCCDGRVDPEAVLGLKPGGMYTIVIACFPTSKDSLSFDSEAIVLRNAGCNVPQNLEDLLLLDHVRGGVEEVLVLEHTDCGVTYATDEEIRESLKKLVPSHSKDIDAFEFGTFKK
ncbi:hypothetical protein BKA67DRAFT_533837 [Truncatella angustata]|uniref:Carbonic anhydrase n=1 Tax=Truncatella angustata TaxID=152316 RepID=A0A9P9A2Z2_9PEZI|nr:uncharacterized protein BKA67DRAFT_533837 [Truncatella angustata]KAH6658716.1 hypothetical protein BKA67DRAFT_533837 [Truncatella angustata]